MTKPNPFANRIIGYGTKAADQFEANPLNYRTHPQKQSDAMQASLRELGWIGVVVENKTTGNLIDGHERVWQALKNNEDVPYIEVELSEAEEKLALAVFDPITYMAETDSAILDELLRDVNAGEDALRELLSQMYAENELTTLQDASDGEQHQRGLASEGKVKPVLHVSQVAIFEQAIRSTGVRNRGDALIAICEFYLSHEEERQLDSILEGVAPA